MSPEGLAPGIVGQNDRLVMIVGNFGSGKTEVAVNLAIQLARGGARVQIADLDIVNPYFRCRESRALMEEHGIRVVVPPGAQAYADLPIILPEIAGMLRPPEGVLSIFDVGGDDVGAKVLSSLKPGIPEDGYELWQVVNSRRPFTETVEGCLEMRRSVERASRLKITGILANSHLIDETTPETILEGWRLAREVARQSDLPVRCVAVMEEWADAPALAEVKAPILRMRRYMVPPWIKAAGEERLPAGRPVPIGKPGPIRTGRRQGDPHGTNRD